MGAALGTWLQAVPLFPLLLCAGSLFSVVFAARVARRLALPVWVVLGLGLSLSLIVAATLSPASAGQSGACLRSMVAPLGRGLLIVSERSLNTWLFVPLGFFAGYAALRRVWILVLAFMVTFAVEGLQRVLPILDRRCQFQDLVDNTWGLILGAAVGLAAALWVASSTASEVPGRSQG
jgi:hypothetical protein